MNLRKFIQAVLFLLCLAPMAYAYCEFIHIVAIVLYTVKVYQYAQKDKDVLVLSFGTLILLFQSFFEVAPWINDSNLTI
jgi:hypothetical protein